MINDKTQSELFSDNISIVLDKIEFHKPNCFVYNNVNLRFALERSLYFSYVKNKELLFSMICDLSTLKNHNQGGKSDFGSNKRRGTNGYVVDLKRVTLNILRIVIGWLREVSISVMALLSIPNRKRIQKNKYFFYCDFIKSAKYFRAVIRSVGVEECVIFIKNNDKPISDYALKENIDCISWKRNNVLKSKINLPLSHPLYSVLRHLALQFDSVTDTITRFRPKKIVFSEGTSSTAAIISECTKQSSTKSIRLQYGKATSLHSGYRNMIFDEMLMWGEGFAERLQSVSPKPLYTCVGHFLLDQVVTDKNPLKNLLRTNHVGPIITIFSQPVCEDLTNSEYDILVDYAYALLKSNEKIIIIVRKHPADISTKFEKIRSTYHERFVIIGSEELSLQQNILASIFVISYNSTTIIESIACNVLPIIICIESIGLTFPYPERFGAALTASSAEEAKNISLRLLNDNKFFNDSSKGLKKFKDQYFFQMDGKSLERIRNRIRA